MADQTLTHIVVKNEQAREHGTFFVVEGCEQSSSGDTRYWCQLTCNTPFGVVGTCFGSMGAPAAKFLSGCNKDYILGRLWGLETEVYDGDVAKANLVEWVLRERKSRELSHDSAKDLLQVIDCADFDNEHSFQSLVYGHAPFYQVFSEGGGSDYKVPNPQAEGFWKYLWPGFLAELAQRAEATANGQAKHTARVLLSECRARRHGHGFWFAFNAAQRARMRASAPAPLPVLPTRPVQQDLFA